jgi:uncharacterized protein (DUF1330 family)
VRKGYAVFTVNVGDWSIYKEYMAGAAPTFAAHGGRLLAADSAPEVVEGEWFGPRTILLEFASPADARAWYFSSDYQALAAKRLSVCESKAVIIAGVDRLSGEVLQ